MKYLIGLLLIFVSIEKVAAAAENKVIEEDSLPIIETFMGNRLTNTACHQSLYPYADLGLVVNCHPYDPTTVASSDIPACASHPLIVSYTQEQAGEFPPKAIQKILASLDASTKIYLNVQDNPWNGTTVDLRAHAFSYFFPVMGANYQGVDVLVFRDDGTIMLKETGSVHLHDGVASPNNFAIPRLDHKHNEAFNSIVTHNGKSVITRHILLTVSEREKFQDQFCVKTEDDRSPSFFAELLGDKYSDFLQKHGII